MKKLKSLSHQIVWSGPSSESLLFAMKSSRSLFNHGAVYSFARKKLRHSELDMPELTGSLLLLCVCDMCASSHMCMFTRMLTSGGQRCSPLPLLLPALAFVYLKSDRALTDVCKESDHKKEMAEWVAGA